MRYLAHCHFTRYARYNANKCPVSLEGNECTLGCTIRLSRHELFKLLFVSLSSYKDMANHSYNTKNCPVSQEENECKLGCIISLSHTLKCFETTKGAFLQTRATCS